MAFLFLFRTNAHNSLGHDTHISDYVILCMCAITKYNQVLCGESLHCHPGSDEPAS